MKFGRFRPLEQIGAGRDGVRFRAEDPQTGRTVDLRDLGTAREDSSSWPSVARRLRASAMLGHPNILGVVALHLEGPSPYVVLDWDDSPSLASARSAGGWGRAEALEIAVGVARGLVAAHRLGLVHGALRPGSIRLGAGRVPIVDWTGLEVDPFSGISTEVADGAVLPPESFLPGAEPAAPRDLFALGVVLRWLLSDPSGSPEPARLEDPMLEALAIRLMHDDPPERPTAREALDALELWLSRPGIGPSGEQFLGSNCETGIIEPSPGPRSPMMANTPAADPLQDRAMLGRFRLSEKLGQGGMGSVYRAVDLTDESEVAIKVLGAAWSTRPEALRRFLKEARLLAEVNSPHVANLIEVNEDDGLHYLALEFVRGMDLATWIARHGRPDEPTALAILADVARALAVAHDRGIIHRDIKPENILLQDVDPDRPPTVKLTDFGLARHVVESDSLVLTQVGSIIGTPLYMAPEQCSGEPLDARTDVYSMGATLFHMLAGRPPFLGDSPLAVISMHRNDPAPSVQVHNPRVSDGAAQIVAKSLAKSPSERYQDASGMLADLERLLRGEPTGINVHPRLPEAEAREMIEFDWRFDLEASPRQLWPHVSNTDRLNKAVGIPAVSFTTEPAEGGGAKRMGEFRKAGMTVAWQEHPFEWVEGRRMGVLREYTQGPFRWFVSVVELVPRAGGGTTLFHRVKIASRGLLGRTLAAVEVGIKGKKAVDGVYHRIDAAILGKLGRDAALDPFEPPSPLSKPRQARLDAWLDTLGSRGLDPGLVERFGEFLAHAPAQEVARIRPIALARRLGVDVEGVVTACLLGAKDGMLVMLWDLLCPVCRVPSQIIETLRALRDHGHCDACQVDFDLDFANSVELIFRVDPSIRDTDLAVYCIGGPAHSQHVAAQARVGPGERVVLDLALGEGAYRFRGPQLPFSVDFRVEAKAATDRWDLPLDRPPGADLPRALRAGGQSLSLSNATDRELVVRIERTTAIDDALTAGRASTLGLFRELFPGEILEPGQLVNVATATFVVTGLDGAEALYERLGDSGAFALIHDHFRRVEAAIRSEGGALVKTIGAGVFAAFNDPVAAVQAALSLPETLDAAAADAGQPGGRALGLKVGVHRGPAMVATLNDHLDYFGSNVRIALALPEHGKGGDLLLTAAVASEPRVAALLQARRLTGEVVDAEIPALSEGYIERIVAATPGPPAPPSSASSPRQLVSGPL